jgi:hypothetical protein
MVLMSLFALVAGQQSPPKAVTLSRVFANHAKYAYDVKSHITLENRAREIETFIPLDYDLNYSFTAEVQQMKTDGIAVLRYQRPSMTQIEGTPDTIRPEVTTKKVNFNYTLTVSPINEILDKVDVVKASPSKKPALLNSPYLNRQAGTDEIQQFVSELYRLALFNGPIESSLDFSPKFPFWDVAPGDTWKRTVGYQPQALKGKKGQEQVVQRLDYTYTYRGMVTANGKSFQRVTADLNLNTDLASWAKQYMTPSPNEPQLSRMPMTLKATIEFDLDPKTFDTVAARAYSNGGFKVFMSDEPNQALFESKLNGTTTLSLRSLTR